MIDSLFQKWPSFSKWFLRASPAGHEGHENGGQNYHLEANNSPRKIPDSPLCLDAESQGGGRAWKGLGEPRACEVLVGGTIMDQDAVLVNDGSQLFVSVRLGRGSGLQQVRN